MTNSVLFLWSAILFSTVTGCRDNSSWVEPLSAAHANLELDWVLSEDLTVVSPADMHVAVGLLEDASVIVMSSEELQKKMPRTSVSKEAGSKFLLVRAVSDMNNSPNSLALSGDTAYSVLMPLGGCRDLQNTALIVKTSRMAKTAKVLCAPTM